MNITDEKSLITFRTICNFVNDLAEEYGKRHKPLLLYKRLANHTQISHDKAIKKHISIFTEFCTANREALETQDSSKLASKRLVYSERVFIDIDFIFRVADAETSPVIWQHLLTISALTDPFGNARDILKKKSGGDETKFITDIIAKVQDNINPNATPMEAITNIIKSGVANDVVGGIKGRLQSGNLDFGKIMGSLKTVLSEFETKADPNSESAKSIHMVTDFLGSMSGESGTPPDMGAMMQMAMGLMANMAEESSSGDGTGTTSGGGGPSMTDMMSLFQLMTSMTGAPPATDGSQQS
jgi:hypothetical protein